MSVKKKQLGLHPLPWRKKPIARLDREQRAYLHEDFMACGVSQQDYAAARGFTKAEISEFLDRRHRMFLARDKFAERRAACADWLEKAVQRDPVARN